MSDSGQRVDRLVTNFEVQIGKSILELAAKASEDEKKPQVTYEELVRRISGGDEGDTLRKMARRVLQSTLGEIVDTLTGLYSVPGVSHTFLSEKAAHEYLQSVEHSAESDDERRVVKTMSGNQRARRRAFQYRNMNKSMASYDGFCFLEPVDYDSRFVFGRLVGAGPTVLDCLSAYHKTELSPKMARRTFVYKMCVGDQLVAYHMTSSPWVGECVGSLPAVYCTMSKLYGKQVFPFIQCLSTGEVVEPLMLNVAIGHGGADVLSPSSELCELAESDFLECKCKLHKKPDLSVHDVVIQPKNAVFRSAFLGTHKACHAEESTRLADKRFLELTMSTTLAQHKSKDVLDAVVGFESVTGISVSDVGTPYSWLIAIRPKLRFRVARLLGPGASLADFRLFVLSAGMKEFKKHKLKSVAPGVYKVVVAGEKGTCLDAGASLEANVVRVLAGCPGARLA